MKIDLKEQNLIDKHSKRLLSALRVICNCYKQDEQDSEIVYTYSSAFLYYSLFVLYAEELKLSSNKAFTEFLCSVISGKLNKNHLISDSFKDVLKEQCYTICEAPVFDNIAMNLDNFKFSLNDVINIAEYLFLDNKGARIIFNTLKLEFLNYLYEMLLQYTIIKTDHNLVVVHKTDQETYKEEELVNFTQLKLNFNVEEETIHSGQWIIQKVTKKKQGQGSFYTPPKIVDYMTEKTFAHYKTVKDLKIIDPACGCGSFLLSTYYYLASKGIKPEDIIENYIYGIDIEPIPVEISKLILKLASGYYSNNILCEDALDKEVLPFKKNNFDIVIGNPPYLNIERIDKSKKDYYLKNYKSAIRRFDLYVLFIEHAIEVLLNKEGTLGFIIPDKLLTQTYANNIRKMILDTCSISQIVELKFNGTAKGANVTQIILICKKPLITDNILKVIQLTQDTNSSNEVKQEDYQNTYNFIFRLSLDENKKDIIEFIQSKSKPLSKACYVSWGLQPGNTKKFIFNEAESEKFKMYKNHPNLKDIIRGGNINSYNITYTNDKVLYITEGSDKLHRPAFPELFETNKIVIPAVSGSRGLIAALDTDHYYTNHSINNVILKKDLLKVDKQTLKARGINLELTKSNLENDLWQIDKGAYTRNTTVYRTDRDSFLNIRFFLALINSKLIRYYFNNHLTGELNVFPELVKRLPYYNITFDENNYNPKDLDKAPVSENFSDMSEQDLHDMLVRLTYDIDKSDPQKRQKHIDLIDKAVYYLYGLSDEFIEAVENDFN